MPSGICNQVNKTNITLTKVSTLTGKRRRNAPANCVATQIPIASGLPISIRPSSCPSTEKLSNSDNTLNPARQTATKKSSRNEWRASEPFVR